MEFVRSIEKSFLQIIRKWFNLSFILPQCWACYQLFVLIVFFFFFSFRNVVPFWPVQSYNSTVHPLGSRFWKYFILIFVVYQDWYVYILSSTTQANRWQSLSCLSSLLLTIISGQLRNMGKRLQCLFRELLKRFLTSLFRQ